jgi:hypothetical protein
MSKIRSQCEVHGFFFFFFFLVFLGFLFFGFFLFCFVLFLWPGIHNDVFLSTLKRDVCSVPDNSLG